MGKSIQRLALFTSPVLAIYGLVPVVIFQSASGLALFISFITLTVVLYGFWQLNIYLYQKEIPSIQKHLISYSCTLVFHASTISLFPGDKFELSANFHIYPILATVAVNSIIIILLTGEINRRKKIAAEAEAQRQRILNLEARHKNLVRQLQPHFLFNTLSSLKSLIMEAPQAATEYAVHLSDFLRYVINVQDQEKATVREELEFAQGYLELQQVRFGKAITYNINIDSSYLSHFVPIFSLQSLLENAIKHNSFTEEEPLGITVTVEENALVVSNKKSLKMASHSTGTGLRNLKERSRLLTGKSIYIREDAEKFEVGIPLVKV
ncbi:MAG: histidine kinase [Bacteroidota bacterium]